MLSKLQTQLDRTTKEAQTLPCAQSRRKLCGMLDRASALVQAHARELEVQRITIATQEAVLLQAMRDDLITREAYEAQVYTRQQTQQLVESGYHNKTITDKAESQARQIESCMESMVASL